MTTARHRTAAAGSVLLALLAMAGGQAAAEPVPGLVAVDESGHRAAAAWPLPAPASDAGWFAPAAGRTLVDDFEGAPWPDPERWVQVLDLDGGGNGEYVWSPRDCHPAVGGRSLWAVGGGFEGSQLLCGASYPDGAASSALLSLDLGAQAGVARLALTFDIWADAAPNEGLFINYVSFDPGGAVRERRTVFSATGRVGAWARAVRLDLTALRDRADGAWRLDLRGRQAYLEFLFISLPNMPDGEGIFLDEIYVDSEDAPRPTATPGGNQTVGCATGADCGTLAVRGYVDGRCDGRYQPGLDDPLRGARVEVGAGAVGLGTTLSKSGNALFRVPLSAGVTAGLVVPNGYMICPNGSGTVTLAAKDFLPFGRKQVEFRVTRLR
jgi:hypothetical protein